MSLTISRNRAATRCSFCFNEASSAHALIALAITLISACTELADPAERGRRLSPETGGDASTRDGEGDGQRAPDAALLPTDEDLDDNPSADRDAGPATDAARPAPFTDGGTNISDAGKDSSDDATVSPPGSSAPCPGGLRFGNSCYRPSLVALSWQDARDDCLAGGGDLVAIDSEGENAFVAGLHATSSWLGANDLQLEGTFRWTDGRALSFVNWGVNQPDAFPGQNCVEKRAEPGSPWYDQSCANLNFYVCERPLE